MFHLRLNKEVRQVMNTSHPQTKLRTPWAARCVVVERTRQFVNFAYADGPTRDRDDVNTWLPSQKNRMLIKNNKEIPLS